MIYAGHKLHALPATWSLPTPGEDVKMVELAACDPEFIEVQQNVLKTYNIDNMAVGRPTIVSVSEKCQLLFAVFILVNVHV